MAFMSSADSEKKNKVVIYEPEGCTWEKTNDAPSPNPAIKEVTKGGIEKVRQSVSLPSGDLFLLGNAREKQRDLAVELAFLKKGQAGHWGYARLRRYHEDYAMDIFYSKILVIEFTENEKMTQCLVFYHKKGNHPRCGETSKVFLDILFPTDKGECAIANHIKIGAKDICEPRSGARYSYVAYGENSPATWEEPSVYVADMNRDTFPDIIVVTVVYAPVSLTEYENGAEPFVETDKYVSVMHYLPGEHKFSDLERMPNITPEPEKHPEWQLLFEGFSYWEASGP